MNNASTRQYRENRAKVPLSELRRYHGKWVAFSADGCQIVAGSSSLTELADVVHAAKQDIENLVVERIEIDSDEINLGAAELI